MCHFQELDFLYCNHLVLKRVECHKKCGTFAPVDPQRRIPLDADCDHERCGIATDRRRREGTVSTLDMTHVAGWEEKREEGQSWSKVRMYEEWKPRIAGWATALAGGSGSGGGGNDGDVGDAGAGALVVYDQDPGHAFWQDPGQDPGQEDPGQAFWQDPGQDLGQASWQAWDPDPNVGFDLDAGQPSSSGAGKDVKSPKKDRKGKGREKEKDRSKETDRGKDKDRGKKKDEGKGKKKSKH